MDLLTALANLGDHLQARWTVTRVTLDCTLVAARVYLLASVVTSRYRGLTLNWRLGLSLSAWAEQRLS